LEKLEATAFEGVEILFFVIPVCFLKRRSACTLVIEYVSWKLEAILALYGLLSEAELSPYGPFPFFTGESSAISSNESLRNFMNFELLILLVLRGSPKLQ
jgi:hypothetical protein